jgi:hypothetical protein
MSIFLNRIRDYRNMGDALAVGAEARRAKNPRERLIVSMMFSRNPKKR